ncbi:MAG TPA: Coenzyme F420 hydrogenase/dehydrogenase, beta subunit C-terminal domain [Candidatus Fimimorpha faecalis]|uniref:Coenzyme F420 hydrogenase/dehydrogenase, beta subunit C-terminal domain n=1 Tax=Candidatus Fimimorpha faecalis TaxID=2840824 RepID=A0A9D1JCA1_9FIRM|nr:Coenzyme F420 hydrogenase/dehydrogenase, beta subunit C-terminal domain [Candidatus Fimimorpha faecalis]
MSKTIEKIEKNQCTGCGLCSVKCPKQCVLMVEDEEGFRFPKIDSSKCVGCGLCLNTCPATTAADGLYSKYNRSYYCGIIKDNEVLIKSSSGGVFGVLAEYIIRNGGYVCGCIYTDEMEAIHILSNRKQDIEKMYGSKYVQSRVEHCFTEILDHLNSNEMILFTGTACQIAALRLFLDKDYSKLYCVEILCHGVPSPGLFRMYKKYLEKSLGGKIKDIRFRDKSRDGWGSEHRTHIIYEKQGKLYDKWPILPAYFSAFFYGLDLRESCYQCKFAKPERATDLTIGDFWGSWAKYKKRFKEGISVIGVNTEKGSDLFLNVSNCFTFLEYLSEKEAIVSNDNFTHSIKRPKERTAFLSDILKKGYSGLWLKTYFTWTCRKKTLVSIYGAFVPEKIRLKIHTIKR